MNEIDCIKFLKLHQPMPADDEWNEECENLDKVCHFLMDHPIEEAIPLLLNVFGEGDGYGVYQQIEHVLMQYKSEEVLPHLLEALNSTSRDIVYWNAQIAASFPDEKLIVPLSRLMNSKDEDVIAASITAIGQINSKKALKALESLEKQSLSEENRALVDDISNDLKQELSDE